jgi:hypothetical protein
MRRFTAAAVRLGWFLLAGCTSAALPHPALAAEPGAVEGYEWMGVSRDGVASFAYGSPETAEDLLFWLTCEPQKKAADMTLYDDIPGAKVGQAVAIEIGTDADKASVPGKVATDEMSGFLFAEAKNFKVKPVIAAFKVKGPLTVKAGALTKILPETGRAEALAAFAKACTLD